MIRRLVNVPPCLVGLEAGSGSHHIARQIKPLGHDVRLIPAQYVKPFLKGHKNDYRDAEAIAEAVQRPTMNFVAIKTPEQSDLLSLHRVRSRLVRQRTAIINQIRGFLIERGITVRQGPAPLRKALPGDLELTSRGALAAHAASHRRARVRTGAASMSASKPCQPRSRASPRTMAACQRLMTVPGIGPIISSAVVAAIGTGSGFKQGRDFAAWLGLVPKQESTGDRTKLGRISKRGNKYLRTLFVQAAHVVLERRPAAAMRALWPWIEQSFQAPRASQPGGDRARQQAGAHRLGRARARARLSAAELGSCCLKGPFARVHQEDGRHPSPPPSLPLLLGLI